MANNKGRSKRNKISKKNIVQTTPLLNSPLLNNLISQWKTELSNILSSLKKNSEDILKVLQNINIDSHPNQYLLEELESVVRFTIDLANFIEANIDYYSKFQNLINSLFSYNQQYTNIRKLIETQNLTQPNIINQLQNNLNNLRNNINQIIIALAVSNTFLNEHPFLREKEINKLKERLKELETDLIRKHQEANEILTKTRDVVEKVTVGTIHKHIDDTLSKIEKEIPKLDMKIKIEGAIFLVYCFIVLLVTLKYFGTETLIFLTVKISLCLPPFLYLLYLLSVLRNKEKLREQYRHKELLARTFLALEETLKKYKTTLGDEISRELLQPILLKLYSDIEHSKEEDLYEMLERVTKIGKTLKI